MNNKILIACVIVIVLESVYLCWPKPTKIDKRIPLLQYQMDSLIVENKKLSFKKDSIQSLVTLHASRIDVINKQLDSTNNELLSAKSKLNTSLYNYGKLSKKVNSISIGDIAGDSLINSLKQKLK